MPIMVLLWWDMPGSMAVRAMVPIGVGDGFLGVLASGAVSVVMAGLGSVSFSGVVVEAGAGAGGRQMMHPTRHFSRNSL